jgi:hypothetical protein
LFVLNWSFVVIYRVRMALSDTSQRSSQSVFWRRGDSNRNRIDLASATTSTVVTRNDPAEEGRNAFLTQPSRHQTDENSHLLDGLLDSVLSPHKLDKQLSWRHALQLAQAARPVRLRRRLGCCHHSSFWHRQEGGQGAQRIPFRWTSYHRPGRLHPVRCGTASDSHRAGSSLSGLTLRPGGPIDNARTAATASTCE